jgi:hypothetical protein
VGPQLRRRVAGVGPAGLGAFEDRGGFGGGDLDHHGQAERQDVAVEGRAADAVELGAEGGRLGSGAFQHLGQVLGAGRAGVAVGRQVAQVVFQVVDVVVDLLAVVAAPAQVEPSSQRHQVLNAVDAHRLLLRSSRLSPSSRTTDGGCRRF